MKYVHDCITGTTFISFMVQNVAYFPMSAVQNYGTATNSGSNEIIPQTSVQHQIL